MHGQQRWLLIYDNAEDPQALADYLPGGAGHVLITSRNPDWHELATPVPVDMFTRQESVSLLCGRVPGLSEPAAERVAEALEDLPLAVQQAAAFLAETGSTVGTYLGLLASRAADVLAYGTSATHQASLAASYQVAFDRLALDEPAALDLLTLAAHLAPEPIPFTLFTTHPDLLPEPLATTAGDPLAFARLTRVLRQRALARISTESMQLHRLVQAILLSRPIGGAAKDGMAVALRLLSKAIPVDLRENPAAWPTWRQLLPHVLTVTSRGTGAADDDVACLLHRAATYHLETGAPRLARPLFERAFELYQRLRGEDHPDTLASATSLGLCRWVLREHQQARQLHEDILTRCRRVLGEDHPTTLSSANNLALALHELGEHQQARQLNEDTLTRRRRVLGEDHPSTLVSANNRAGALRELGELHQARQLDEDTLTRRRRVLGGDHPDTLTSAISLALDLHELGELHQARQLHEDTLTRFRRIVGEDHPYALTSASYLAISLRAAGEHQQARQLDEDTLTRRRRILGEDHPDTLTSAANLALDLHALGEHQQARQLEEYVRAHRKS